MNMKLPFLCIGLMMFISTSWPDFSFADDEYSIAPHSAPSVSSRGPGRMDVFVQGENGHLMAKYWTGGSGKFTPGSWSKWRGLGGRLSSAPACVSWEANRIECFARGTDQQLWQRSWGKDGGWLKWKAHKDLKFASSPSVSSRGPGRMDVFVLGENGHLMAKYWTGGSGKFTPGSWSKWRDLGGRLSSAPACVSWEANRIECFARGTDQQLWQRSWGKDGGWLKWKAHKDLKLASSPSVSSRGPGRMDVFVQGENRHLMAKYWTDGPGKFTPGSWSKWQDLGGKLSSAPASVSWGPDRIEVMFRNQDGCLGQRSWARQWFNWKIHKNGCKTTVETGKFEGKADSYQAGILPSGSYTKTCKNSYMQGDWHLTASCGKFGDGYRTSSLYFENCKAGIANIDGWLTCDKGPVPAPPGSYKITCYKVFTDENEVSAQCRKKNGEYEATKLENWQRCNTLWNEDGFLRCAMKATQGNCGAHGEFQCGYPNCRIINKETGQIDDSMCTCDVNSPKLKKHTDGRCYSCGLKGQSCCQGVQGECVSGACDPDSFICKN